VQDGRNLLLTQQNQYDVIVSEPSNPWQSGNANLFTREFYQLAASRLKQGGLFAQWLFPPPT
jgi:spermidine synthase